MGVPYNPILSTFWSATAVCSWICAVLCTNSLDSKDWRVPVVTCWYLKSQQSEPIVFWTPPFWKGLIDLGSASNSKPPTPDLGVNRKYTWLLSFDHLSKQYGDDILLIQEAFYRKSILATWTIKESPHQKEKIIYLNRPRNLSCVPHLKVTQSYEIPDGEDKKIRSHPEKCDQLMVSVQVGKKTVSKPSLQSLSLTSEFTKKKVLPPYCWTKKTGTTLLLDKNYLANHLQHGKSIPWVPLSRNFKLFKRMNFTITRAMWVWGRLRSPSPWEGARVRSYDIRDWYLLNRVYVDRSNPDLIKYI